jgi:hypothetical protein
VKKGREGRREGWREGEKTGRREGGREGEKTGRREGGREGGRLHSPIHLFLRY